MRKESGDLFECTEKKRFFQGDKNEKVKSPENKVPAGPMPHTCQEPDNKEVEINMLPVSSKRDIYIIPENTSE
jgi:hypothetical protein